VTIEKRGQLRRRSSFAHRKVSGKARDFVTEIVGLEDSLISRES